MDKKYIKVFRDVVESNKTTNATLIPNDLLKFLFNSADREEIYEDALKKISVHENRNINVTNKSFPSEEAKIAKQALSEGEKVGGG